MAEREGGEDRSKWIRLEETGQETRNFRKSRTSKGSEGLSGLGGG